MPKSTEPDQEYITPSEAKGITYLSTKQLTRLADDGQIRFIRPGVHRRYLREDILRLSTPSAPTDPASTIPQVDAGSLSSSDAA